MQKVTWSLVVLLLILHHDWWWWDDSETLVLGVVPVGLAWHAGISIAAGGVWAMALKYCWPKNVDEPDASSTAPVARREAHA